VGLGQSGRPWQSAATGPAAGIGAFLVGVYLAMHACFAGEFLAIYLHLPIMIVAPVGILIMLTALASGRALRFFRTPVAIPFLILLALWVLSMLIFSLRGSYIPFAEYAARYHLLPLYLCALLPGLKQMNSTIRFGALGFFCCVISCAIWGATDNEGRFGIQSTSLQNPNDLAFNLTMACGFFVVAFYSRSWLPKLGAVVGIAGAVYYILRTGSRANLIVLMAMVLISWLALRGRQRVVLLVLCVVLAGGSLPFLPKSILLRLTTFTSSSSDELQQNAYLDNAIASTRARQDLQMRAFRLAVQNPILGVGPGMYMYALNDMMIKQEGLGKGSWQAAHNTYMEYWAETGTPAFLLYLYCLFWCAWTNFRNYRFLDRTNAPPEAKGPTMVMLLMSVSYIVGTVFCNMLYQSPACFVVGLTAANHLALQDGGLLRWVGAGARPKPLVPATGASLGLPNGKFAHLRNEAGWGNRIS
jgi:O-antigen ligase